MTCITRNFNTDTHEFGDITIYLLNDHSLSVSILHLFGLLQKHMYIEYPPNIDKYDMCITIFDRFTEDIKEHNTETVYSNYKDTVRIDEPTENSFYCSCLGDYVLFTRDSVESFEYEDDVDENDSKNTDQGYLDHDEVESVCGEVLENGEFVYEKFDYYGTYDGMSISDRSESVTDGYSNYDNDETVIDFGDL